MFKKENYAGIKAVFAVAAVAVLAVVFALAAKNGIKAELLSDRITVKSAMFNESINYSEITDVRLLNSVDYGQRVSGVGIPGLNTGHFKNSGFGDYQCAVTRSASMCIAIKKTDGSYLVFNQKSDENTENLYNRIKEKMPHTTQTGDSGQ